MSLIAFPTLLRKLKSKEYREAYVESNIKHGIARQIRTIREQRNWSQSELAEQVGKLQSVISRLENPSYGQFSIQTLLKLAAAFDVGLIVRFVKFDEFIRDASDVSPKSFEVLSFNEELEHALKEDEFNNYVNMIKESQASSNLVFTDQRFPFINEPNNKGAKNKYHIPGQERGEGITKSKFSEAAI